jgi:uncharacterized protein (DUF362 family)
VGESEQKPPSRRDFLGRIAASVGIAGVAAGAGVLLHDRTGRKGISGPTPLKLQDYFARISYGPSDMRISVARGRNVPRMLAAALEPMGGIKRFVTVGDVVLVKPNVAFDRSPMMAATTSPDVVAAVVTLCRQAGAKKVIVADNPIESPEGCFAKSGIAAAARAAGAVLSIPTAGKFRPVAVRDRSPNVERREVLGTWSVLWQPLKEADKVIGLPAIKDHNLCYASMAMKNWYGLLGGRRNQFHQAIHETVSDLGFMVSPTLIIADGTRVLTRNGPTGGRLSDVKEMNTIVASVDQVACDAWCYRHLLERDPARLEYLELASEKFGGGKAGTRLGQCDWQDYKRRGLIAECNV